MAVDKQCVHFVHVYLLQCVRAFALLLSSCTVIFSAVLAVQLGVMTARSELVPGWGKRLPPSFMSIINNEWLACVLWVHYFLAIVFNF